MRCWVCDEISCEYKHVRLGLHAMNQCKYIHISITIVELHIFSDTRRLSLTYDMLLTSHVMVVCMCVWMIDRHVKNICILWGHSSWLEIQTWVICMARFVVKNGHQQDMCFGEIGPCAQNISINISPTIDALGMTCSITSNVWKPHPIFYFIFNILTLNLKTQNDNLCDS